MCILFLCRKKFLTCTCYNLTRAGAAASSHKYAGVAMFRWTRALSVAAGISYADARLGRIADLSCVDHTVCAPIA